MIKKFIRVACYVRVSTDNQLENYSIEEQTERLKAYCSAKDWHIYRVYTDGGYSGGNVERPALKQMIDDIKKNKIDVVMVYKLDSLSRSQKDTLTLIEDNFLTNGVEFVSMSENFDTSSPFGRAMIGILSVFAQLEKDQITERFTMGRIGRSKAGYFHGGSNAPTGYNYIDGKLIVDEYKAMQVQEIYDRFLSGYSIRSIQRYMNEKYGGWNRNTLIYNMLKNSIYIGKVKFNKVTYDGIHEPIISVDTFEKVQALINSQEREDKKTSRQKTPFKASNLLTSIVYCDKCGARYVGAHNYYKCYSRSKTDKNYIVDPNCKNKHWEIEKLNNIIIGQIEKLRHDKKYIDSLFAVKNAEPSINIKALDKRISEIDKQISKLIDLYQLEGISIEDIRSRVDELQKEKDVLSEKVTLPVADVKETKAKFISTLNGFDDIFTSSTLEEKRLFVSSIIKSIVINNENISINWRI